MGSYNNKSILTTLSTYKYYILLTFICTAAIFAGEHFKPTLKFIFQWIHSKFVGSSENYPEKIYVVEALFFFSKTATAFLTGLSILILFGLFFSPALGFSEIIEKLVIEKNERIKTLREYEELHTKFVTFVSRADQHQRSQLALMAKYDSIIEHLNLNTMNAQKGLKDLSVRINQLRAISAALGKELDTPNETDEGDF